VFHKIAAFGLVIYSTYEREHVAFGLLKLVNFTSGDVLQFYLPVNDKISFFFVPEKNSIVCKHHIFLIHLSEVEIDLGCSKT
jgi:uncharacterized protein (AIM24 family)